MIPRLRAPSGAGYLSTLHKWRLSIVQTSASPAVLYLDFAGNIGIVGTPVIDAVGQTIYFVARTKENGVFVQRLHAFDIRNGSDRPGSPVVIQASAPGTGDGSIGGVVAFNARTHNQRAGLMLLNGIVYIAWASHCDQGPYHGWILGYNASTLQQSFVFNTTPDGRLGGVWQSGQAMSADANGNIYVLTGNGDFDANQSGGRNYGTSFLKISPAGTVLDWFTPHDWQALNDDDLDLFHGAVLIPNTNLLIGGGKGGTLYVLDRTNMGRITSNDNQIVQSLDASTSGRMNGSAVFWNTPTNGPVIYLWPGGDPLKAFRLANGRFQTTPIAESSARAPFSMPGGIMSLSAFGSSPGSGILWATMSNAGDANNATQPGIVRAYDANDVRIELWNSEQNPTRDRLGNFAKFNPPTIANGKLFAPTLSNKLVAYGLLAGNPGNQAPVVNAGADQSITLPATVALSGTAVDDGNPNPPGALTIAWTLVTGPGTVTFTNPNALSTTASFSTAGAYTLRLSASDSAAGGSDQVVVNVAPAVGSGTGLRAEYFNDAGNNTYFTTAVLSRVDPTLDFTWGDAAPAAGVQADNFSVRWTGQVQATLTGNYTFTTVSNDGIRLWVNGQLLIDNWTDHDTVINTSAEIALVMSVSYDIRVEYYDHTGPAVARLLWTPPGQALGVVPQGSLFPSPPPNQPPIVNAGPDQIIGLPNNTVTVRGSASDDGLPAPPGMLTYAWTKVSGREESDNPVVFSNRDALTTAVTFPASDVYILRLTVSDGAVTVSDDVAVTVNPAPSGSVTGLQGQYYNGMAFNTLRLTRTDPVVNFNWEAGSPGAGVQPDNFSVRWTGQVQAVVSGAHTFFTYTDDGVRLWVNGQLVIDSWINQSGTLRSSAPISLVANQLYQIRMDFYENAGDAIAQLLWNYPGQARTPIPQSQLYTPSAANQAPMVNAGVDARRHLTEHGESGRHGHRRWAAESTGRGDDHVESDERAGDRNVRQRECGEHDGQLQCDGHLRAAAHRVRLGPLGVR